MDETLSFTDFKTKLQSYENTKDNVMEAWAHARRTPLACTAVRGAEIERIERWHCDKRDTRKDNITVVNRGRDRARAPDDETTPPPLT